MVNPNQRANARPKSSDDVDWSAQVDYPVPRTLSDKPPRRKGRENTKVTVTAPGLKRSVKRVKRGMTKAG